MEPPETRAQLEAQASVAASPLGIGASCRRARRSRAALTGALTCRYAFRAIVGHLQGVSEDCSNIDIMNAAGMCRNCVAKWYHGGMVYAGATDATYESALESVYGESYGSWKAKHQKKATEEQLARFEATKRYHAKHVPVAQITPAVPRNSPRSPRAAGIAAAAGDFNITVAPPPKKAPPPRVPVAPGAEPCCYDDDDDDVDDEDGAGAGAVSPAPPPAAKTLKLGILTVSDRASKGTYKDETGPALEKALDAYAVDVKRAIVPDDAAEIAAAIAKWADADRTLVLTAGGTGFGPRDVTPEATKEVLDKEAPGIIDVVHADALKRGSDLDSLLSRATAGVRKACVVVNLPGRPAAATRNANVLLPTLLKAVALATSEQVP